MNMLIAGRGEPLKPPEKSEGGTHTDSDVTAVQGFGGGGCLASVQIINADMIPLPDRGFFQGVTSL